MTEIMITAVDEHKVEFSSALGSGAAIWVGMPPRQGNTYYVEIDIDDIFQWGKNINISVQENPKIDVVGNNLLLFGKIIAYEDDGLLAVKVGGDVIFLEVSDAPGEGENVTFYTSINNVSLHPVNL
ncbi:hypothetical protein [Kosakonia cowanii]|jgi:hypothetical protein|uniref:hypothetical protein n=1 Tax=Kosakonia cowanii TaxID=208223 RepID=UPI001F595CB0|nr:hypothetical protein [Kosakonia cowanii]MDT3410432.1 mevalonate kinase [Atlantibacter sp. SORGH_AS_0304]